MSPEVQKITSEKNYIRSDEEEEKIIDSNIQIEFPISAGKFFLIK
jgi:hypothetical protein